MDAASAFPSPLARSGTLGFTWPEVTLAVKVGSLNHLSRTDNGCSRSDRPGMTGRGHTSANKRDETRDSGLDKGGQAGGTRAAGCDWGENAEMCPMRGARLQEQLYSKSEVRQTGGNTRTKRGGDFLSQALPKRL